MTVNSRSLSFALVLALSPGVTNAKSITTPDKPAEVAAAFETALASGNAEVASALLAADVLIYESGGQESSRDEYAAAHMKGDMAFLGASKREVLSRAEGGDNQNAWVSTRSRIIGHHRDKDVDILSTETLVLKKTSEGWRIVHIHWSSRPATKSH